MANDCRDPLNLPWYSPTRPATFDGGLKYYEQLLALKARIDALCAAFQAADIGGIIHDYNGNNCRDGKKRRGKAIQHTSGCGAGADKGGV